LRNLLSNAIKFTHLNGNIKIAVKKNVKEILISVSDNGIGIAEADIKKLFNMEENLSTLGTSNEKGTGLGLILCKEFVEKHQGTIGVESNVGNSMEQGSTFYFTIPIK